MVLANPTIMHTAITYTAITHTAITYTAITYTAITHTALIIELSCLLKCSLLSGHLMCQLSAPPH